MKRSKEDQHIYVGHNGKFYLRYRANGLNLDRTPLVATDILSAQREKLEIIEKYSASKEYLGPKTKVSMLAGKYLDYHFSRFKIGKLRETSFKEKQWLMGSYIVPCLGDFQPNQITKAKWLELTTSDYCKKIKNFQNLRKVLVNFLTWCKDPENGRYIQEVPKFELPNHEVRESKVLSQEEIDKIHQCLNHTDDNQRQDIKDIWKLLSLTGCRKMEIQGLSWDRVDFVTNRIITKDYDTKNKSRRIIPLSTESLNILKRRYESKYSNYVFGDRTYNERPYYPDHFKGSLKVAIAAAGLSGFQFKDLRSTFATMVLDNTGLAIEDATKYLGHSKKILEDLYRKNHISATNRVVETVEKVFTKPKLRVL